MAHTILIVARVVDVNSELCLLVVCVLLDVGFFFQAEDGIRDLVRSRGLGDVYKRQLLPTLDIALSSASISSAAPATVTATLRDAQNAPLAGQLVGFSVVRGLGAVSYTHLRAHETVLDLVCRLLLEKKNTKKNYIDYRLKY